MQKIKEVVKSRLLQCILVFMIGGISVFLWQENKRKNAIIEYKDKLIATEMQLERLKEKKKSIESSFLKEISGKDKTIQAYQQKYDSIIKILKEDEKAIIEYSGDFNDRFSKFAELITDKD